MPGLKYQTHCNTGNRPWNIASQIDDGYLDEGWFVSVSD